ncbi:MAG: response regulator [Bacteroidota bacterium]
MKKFNLIIFIDDDEATNFYHKIVAELAGVSKEVIFYQKASEALEFYKNLTKEDQLPEIIFLDINMPRIDGWEFLEQFSKIEMEERPIIFMVSTSLNQRDLDKAEEHPLVARFIQKPVTEDQLIALRKEILLQD